MIADDGSTSNEKEEQSERKVALPSKMPDEWLKQLSGVMPSRWTILLGSAVLAAFIGWASSYSTARMTISANLDLEKTKVALQFAQEQAHAVSASYANLAGALNDLSSAFGSYLVLVAVASEQQMGACVKAALSAQLSEVGKADAKVAAAIDSPSMASVALKYDVDACLAQLAPVLVQGSREPKSILAHRDIEAKIHELMVRAQQNATSPSIQLR